MAKIPLPNDGELDERTLKFIAGLPKLNVVRMLARTGIAPEIYTTISAIFSDNWFPKVRCEIMLFRICRANKSQYEIDQHLAYGGIGRTMVLRERDPVGQHGRAHGGAKDDLPGPATRSRLRPN